MAITIKHLDGPLKGERQDFDDSAATIVIGRSAEAQIVYPEECNTVGEEHLRLNRNDGGDYTIELPGSGYVEIDGSSAKNGAPVSSGSVVRVGRGGPTFEVLMPGVTIRHLEGPLAGQHQHFDPDADTITFGRPDQTTDISYPQTYDTVGRLHFSLKKSGPGTYCVLLTPGHYVAINGTEADNNAVVQSRSTFKLGGDTGPSFSIVIEQPLIGGIKTKPNKPQTLVREELHKTKQQGTYALATLGVLVLALGGYASYRDWRYEQQLAMLTQDISDAKAKASALAANEIPADATKALQAAVYLVAKKEGGGETPEATAWAFASDKLATNAHVTEAIKGHEKEFELIAPNGDRINIKSVMSHPAYLIFGQYKGTQGKLRWGKFKPLDLINEYDVGIIEIDPETPLPVDAATGKPVTLELAPDDHVKALEPGAAVASVGFPTENVVASSVAIEAPGTLHFGNISSLTDVFMSRADQDHRLLIQHSVPVTGGASGSPLIDASGKVIGIVNGGNTTVLKDEKEAANDKLRIPSAVLINFAQRIDSLEELADGDAAQHLAADRLYWETVAQKFDSYFKGAADDFVALAAERYGVADPKTEEIGKGTLEPRKAGATSFVSASYDFEAEPGHVYGFIAEAKSGVLIGINVKKKGTSEFLRDAKDPRKTNEPELAPTAWLTVTETTQVEIDVDSLTSQPAEYVLRAYIWDEPNSGAAAAATAPQP
jgi:hypothetical protein